MSRLKHFFSGKNAGRIYVYTVLLWMALGMSPHLYAQKAGTIISDIDGNTYKTLVFGQQEWMVENLRTTRFHDGTAIPNITDETEWIRVTSPAYCVYDNEVTDKAAFGGLYNWQAVHTGKLCPEGWHVPTDHEWTALIESVGGDKATLKKLEQAGFPVTPAGYRYGYYWGAGIYYEKGVNGYWWTASPCTDTHIWSRTINLQTAQIYRSYFEKNNGFSVRCIKSSPSQGTITDVDGNPYHTVVIGDQEWMLENLKTTRYNDGTPIPNVTDVTEWRNIDKPAYVWYNNDISNKEPYGALYNWHVAGSSKALCPDGWRVASDEDWKILEHFLGMEPEQIEGTSLRGADEGGKLKEVGFERWKNPNKGATNEVGLTIIPSGRRDSSGKFYDMGTGATIWTSSETSESCAYYRHFATNVTTIGRNPEGDKKFGLAIRCIRIN